MGKRTYNLSSFGGYLNALRKERGIGFDKFRVMLGVSKAYLNDVETDACRPPTADVQFRMVALLGKEKPLTGEELERFFSLAAEGRGELPADVTRYLSSNGSALDAIRANPDYKLYWQKFGL